MGRIKLFMIFLGLILVLITSIFITNKLGHSQEPCCGGANRGNTEMMQDMMSGRLPPGIEPEDLPAPESKGAELVVLYCTQCHNLPSPSMHTSEQWPGVAQRMFKRLSWMSERRKKWMGMMWMKAPSPDEQKNIVAYLKAYSLKSIRPDTIPSPESPGAISFKNVCSQCHALPDPKLHTAVEWPAVVERMQVNMKIMDKPVITDHEKEKIITYLIKHANQ
jgi:hypothetical protein